MSIQTATEEYTLALRQGQKEYKELTAAGQEAYPLVLDELLPDRTPRAIDVRRHERGLTNPHLAPSPRWTREQRDALVRSMRELCEKVGHDPYEVRAETHRLLARAAHKRRESE